MLSNSMPARPEPFSAEATAPTSRACCRTRGGGDASAGSSASTRRTATSCWRRWVGTAREPSPSCPRAETDGAARPRLDRLADRGGTGRSREAPSARASSPRTARGGCASPWRGPATSSRWSATRRAIAGRGPRPASPSTHVVKPETGEYPEYVANEMFCMTVCRQAGLPVAKATVERSPGGAAWSRPATTAASARACDVRRLHCESLCQALGISPSPRRRPRRAKLPVDRSARAAERGLPARRPRQPAHSRLPQLHPRQRRRPRQELRRDRSRTTLGGRREMAAGAASPTSPRPWSTTIRSTTAW